MTLADQCSLIPGLDVKLFTIILAGGAPVRPSRRRRLRDQGKRDEARELLAPVYGWFTEGFDTRDCRQAATNTKLGAIGLRAAVRYLLDMQARPSPIGLHAPLQHSASAAQAEPSALQATSRGSGVDVAALGSVKKAVTVRCEAAFCSCSHAAAGKAATPTKSAKNIDETARIRMITSL